MRTQKKACHDNSGKPFYGYEMQALLDGALHGQNECAQTQFGRCQVHLVQLVEYDVHAAVVNNGQDGRGN